MIKAIAKGVILGVALGCAVNTPAVAQPTSVSQSAEATPLLGEWRFEAPKASVCVEDMPCWRVWMGNGVVGTNPPAYMYLPEGPQWDKIAPFLGYKEA